MCTVAEWVESATGTKRFVSSCGITTNAWEDALVRPILQMIQLVHDI